MCSRCPTIEVGVKLLRKFGTQRGADNLRFCVIHDRCPFMSANTWPMDTLTGKHSQRLGICESIAMRISEHITVS